jgi:hypothetical protein
MTLLDFEELAGYWSEHPPLHMLLAAYLGVGTTRVHGNRPPPGKAELSSLLAELGPGFAAGDVHAGLGEVALDFRDLKRRGRSAE